MREERKVFDNKEVLVTGGLGFIGSNLVRALCVRGEEVVLVPMAELAGKTKPVPPDLLRIANVLV